MNIIEFFKIWFFTRGYTLQKATVRGYFTTGYFERSFFVKETAIIQEATLKEPPSRVAVWHKR